MLCIRLPSSAYQLSIRESARVQKFVANWQRAVCRNISIITRITCMRTQVMRLCLGYTPTESFLVNLSSLHRIRSQDKYTLVFKHLRFQDYALFSKSVSKSNLRYNA
jgi:hypothetical protein